METFSLFSEEYNSLFIRNYQQFSENIKKTNKNKLISKVYSLFFPSCGSKKKEDIQFIIYGQATNGWNPVFKVVHPSKHLLHAAIEYSNTTDPEEICPIEWVQKKWTEYKLYNSFFWNVTYKLINRYNKEEDESNVWVNHIVWSNLMKISPAEGGNPYGKEWDSQFQGAKSLFTKEIEEIRPKFVIILTNWDWANDFLADNPGFSFNIETRYKFIQAKGEYNSKTKILVTKRPRVGDNESCVTEILDLIK